jgi:hypothetical protein
MMARRRAWRILTALVAGAALWASAVLPPEHAHPADRHQHPAVVHRHLALHVPHHSPHPALNDQETVIWLDRSYLGGVTFAASVAPEPTAPLPVPPLTASIALIEATPPSIHGPPPRPSSPRAPPISLL